MMYLEVIFWSTLGFQHNCKPWFLCIKIHKIRLHWGSECANCANDAQFCSNKLILVGLLHPIHSQYYLKRLQLQEAQYKPASSTCFQRYPTYPPPLAVNYYTAEFPDLGTLMEIFIWAKEIISLSIFTASPGLFCFEDLFHRGVVCEQCMALYFSLQALSMMFFLFTSSPIRIGNDFLKSIALPIALLCL